jgi:putative SOS response-associated peptidase YedK
MHGEKPKFATYNARIESVLDKSTWKNPFLRHRAITPMTHFYEACHKGTFKGNIIKITPKKASVLYAAAIFEKDTFALLTGTPYPSIRKAGHDRSPIFLTPESADKYASLPEDGARILQFLEKNRFDPGFEIEIDRPLKH